MYILEWQVSCFVMFLNSWTPQWLTLSWRSHQSYLPAKEAALANASLWLNISLTGFFSNPVFFWFFFCICTLHCTRRCFPTWKRTLQSLSLPLRKAALSSGRSESHKSLKLNICTVTHVCWNTAVFCHFKPTKHGGRREMSVIAVVCLSRWLFESNRKKERKGVFKTWSRSMCVRVRIFSKS